jgi:hypothetical protein
MAISTFYDLIDVCPPVKRWVLDVYIFSKDNILRNGTEEV